MPCRRWHAPLQPVGDPLPALPGMATQRPPSMLLAQEASPGRGMWTKRALAGVEGGISGDILADHNDPVLQVTDGARHTAGRAVEPPLRVDSSLQAQHRPSRFRAILQKLKSLKRRRKSSDQGGISSRLTGVLQFCLNLLPTFLKAILFFPLRHAHSA